MSRIVYVVLVGPPASRKTDIAAALYNELKVRGLRVFTDSFMRPIKQLITIALAERWRGMHKQRQRAELNGYSTSQFISETVAFFESRLGADILGRWLAYRALVMHGAADLTYVVVDDGCRKANVEMLLPHVVINVGRSFNEPAWCDTQAIRFDHKLVAASLDDMHAISDVVTKIIRRVNMS